MDEKQKKSLVLAQACFAKLTEPEIDVLTSIFLSKEFKAGETLVREGDLVDNVYIIISGAAEVQHVYLEKGVAKVSVLAKLGPNDAIGLNETGFYSLTGRRTATVVALTDLMTLCLSVAAFHGFALAYPHVNEVMHEQAKIFLDT